MDGLHYIKYDPEALWNSMITAYAENGGASLKPGDEKEMLLRTVQAVVTQICADVDNALRMKTLRYAEGEYLDVLGENRGMLREDVVNTHKPVVETMTYKCFGDARNYTLPPGVTVTPDGKTLLMTTEATDCKCHTQSGPVYLKPVSGELDTTGVIPGTKLYPATQADRTWVDYMVVTSVEAGGNSGVTDDLYRYAIMAHMIQNATTGTRTQVLQSVKTEYMKMYDASEEEVPKIVILGESELDVYINANARFVAQMNGVYTSGTYNMPIGMTVRFHEMEKQEVELRLQFYVRFFNADGSERIGYSQWYSMYAYGFFEKNFVDEINAWADETSAYGNPMNFADLLTRAMTYTKDKERRVYGVRTRGFRIGGVQQTQVTVGGKDEQTGQLIYFPEENKYYHIKITN